MAHGNTATVGRATHSARAGKATIPLARKVKDPAPAVPDLTLEAGTSAVAEPSSNTPGFDPSTHVQAEPIPQALPSSSSAVTTAPAQPPAAPVDWSNEDETGFQALLARRKAAGYQRRGRDVSEQVLCRGTIKPNPDTVAATIVGIVAERVQIGRAELIGLMGQATFPHRKALPTDKGWCQGYVAGAIRNGFLAVAAEPFARVGEEA